MASKSTILAAAALVLLAGCSSSGEPEPTPLAADAPVAPAPGDPDPTLIKTAEGDVRGTSLGGDTRVFKGIPFAAPPTGDLRWRPPAPAAAWQGERAATAFASMCTQIDYASDRTVGSEDCLYLNVWTPAARGEALPVLFWIHGGDNVIGSASEDYYDAKELAERAHAIVVTINYRLGAFGFLAHPAFATESSHHSAGNYGILDAVAALEWTKRNVAAFGGDVARVLVFGQSAGASNTCALIASPLAKGLFSRAMMLSLSCAPLSEEVVASTNASAQHRLGCDGATDVAACLRGKSAADVANLPGASLRASEDAADYYGTVDGWVLPDDPQVMIAKGRHNHVPMIAGTTKDEYSSIIDLVVPEGIATEADYRAKVESWFGKPLVPKVLGLYPFAGYATPRIALAAILSDQLMHCPTRKVARGAVGTQKEPVHRYLFAHAPTAGAAAATGAGHGIDVSYLFRTFSGFTRTADDEVVADALIAAVAHFAATGTTSWPRYDAATDPYAVLDTKPSEGRALHTTACDFWDSVAP